MPRSSNTISANPFELHRQQRLGKGRWGKYILYFFKQLALDECRGWGTPEMQEIMRKLNKFIERMCKDGWVHVKDEDARARAEVYIFTRP